MPPKPENASPEGEDEPIAPAPDPFEAFTEWAGPGDEVAYREL